MIRSATAVWSESDKDGRGNVSTQSKVVWNVFFTKVQDNPADFGTNEFELLAASISVSFVNSLGELLSKEGIKFELLEAKTELTVFREITQANLSLRIIASIIYKSQLVTLIEKAKSRCSISKTFNIPINIKII